MWVRTRPAWTVLMNVSLQLYDVVLFLAYTPSKCFITLCTLKYFASVPSKYYLFACVLFYLSFLVIFECVNVLFVLIFKINIYFWHVLVLSRVYCSTHWIPPTCQCIPLIRFFVVPNLFSRKQRIIYLFLLF